MINPDICSDLFFLRNNKNIQTIHKTTSLLITHYSLLLIIIAIPFSGLAVYSCSGCLTTFNKALSLLDSRTINSHHESV